MCGTIAETRRLVSELRMAIGDAERPLQIVVAPPFPALAAAHEALAGSTIELAAQNVHWEDKGAFTGEVSVPMLREVGCRSVIVGHSERRQLFGETDDGVNRRARAALAGGLRPIVCVGETLSERVRDHTLDVVGRQIRSALLHVSPADIQALCIAYEPVWAIGTGRTATPDQAEEVHANIRAIVAELAGAETAERVRILYGGSVKPDNVDSLMAEANVDGALVGGASLDAKSFARIVDFRASKSAEEHP
jgi:triosephosphate isomerase (TIM)